MSDLTVVFSIKVFKKGSPEPVMSSALSLPLPMTEEERQRAVEAWHVLLHTSLLNNVAELTATLDTKERKPQCPTTPT